MYRLIQMTLSLAIFVLVACSSSPNTDNQIATSSPRPATLPPAPTKLPTPTITLPQIPTRTTSDLLIIMDRSYCYGKCPVYQLTIDAKGYVSYEGIWNVKVEGVRKAWINSQKIQELITAIEDSNFFALDDRYYAGVDLPSVNLAIILNGRSKSVWHQSSGCSNTFGEPPPEVCELETLIDEITNSSQWVGQVDIFGINDQA